MPPNPSSAPNWLNSLPSYRLKPFSVPIHRFPNRSSSSDWIFSFANPSPALKCVNCQPSYRLRPP